MPITPYLYYEDVAAALDFLEKAFGFTPLHEQVANAESRITHAAMQLGNDLIMMGWPGPQYRNPKHLGQPTQNLYVNIQDVDTHFQRAKQAGAAIIEEPKDTDYGDRRYAAADPEGHVWYFAESAGDKSSTVPRGDRD